MMIGATIQRISEEMDAARAKRDSEAVQGLCEDMLAEALRAIANGHTDPAGVAQIELWAGGTMVGAYPLADRPWEPTPPARPKPTGRLRVNGGPWID